MEIKRYKNNPILVKGTDNAWENLCVLNPGVIYDENRKKFVMLYRAGGDDLKHMISVGIAESDDGFHFPEQRLRQREFRRHPHRAHPRFVSGNARFVAGLSRQKAAIENFLLPPNF